MIFFADTFIPPEIIPDHVLVEVMIITDDQSESYRKALAGDPLSAFGGIVAFNQKLTLETAKMLIKNFYEVIAAPGFEKDVLLRFNILSTCLYFLPIDESIDAAT